jgi:hypothetical protein
MKITEKCWDVIFSAEMLVDSICQEDLTGEAWENYHNLCDAIEALNDDLMNDEVAV